MTSDDAVSLSGFETLRLGAAQAYYSISRALKLDRVAALLQRAELSLRSPIYLLGRRYGLSTNTDADAADDDDDLLVEEDNKKQHAALSELVRRFGRVIWMSYRSEFPPLTAGETVLRSDAGWGCTIRSIQMLMAQTLQLHLLREDWQWPSQHDDETQRHPTEGHKKSSIDAAERETEINAILRLFWDLPSSSCPFSIHNICASGADSGIVPGRWLGPWAASQALAAAARKVEDDLKLRVTVLASTGGGAPILYRDAGLRSWLEAKGSTEREQRRPKDPGSTATDDERDASHPGCGCEQASEGAGDRRDLVFEIRRIARNDERRVDTAEFRDDGAPCPPMDSGRDRHGGVGCDATPSKETELNIERRGHASTLQGIQTPSDPGLLILVPLLLGIEKLNPAYVAQVCAVFSIPYTVGIVGGRPSSSLYFVGCQSDALLYLDPHALQPCACAEKDWTTFKGDVLRTLPLAGIDPSIAIGFYCRTVEDFDSLCGCLEHLERDHASSPLMCVRSGKEPDDEYYSKIDSAWADDDIEEEEEGDDRDRSRAVEHSRSKGPRERAVERSAIDVTRISDHKAFASAISSENQAANGGGDDGEGNRGEASWRPWGPQCERSNDVKPCDATNGQCKGQQISLSLERSGGSSCSSVPAMFEIESETSLDKRRGADGEPRARFDRVLDDVSLGNTDDGPGNEPCVVSDVGCPPGIQFGMSWDDIPDIAGITQRSKPEALGGSVTLSENVMKQQIGEQAWMESSHRLAGSEDEGPQSSGLSLQPASSVRSHWELV